MTEPIISEVRLENETEQLENKTEPLADEMEQSEEESKKEQDDNSKSRTQERSKVKGKFLYLNTWKRREFSFRL